MSEADKADLLYGVRAIAEYLGIPARAAQHKIDAGKIPTFRLGANICARRSRLTAWLAECEAKADQERADRLAQAEIDRMSDDGAPPRKGE